MKNPYIEINHIRKLYRDTGRNIKIVGKGKKKTISGFRTIDFSLKRKQISFYSKHHRNWNYRNLSKSILKNDGFKPFFPILQIFSASCFCLM